MKKVLILVREINSYDEIICSYLNSNMKQAEVTLGTFEQVNFKIQKGKVEASWGAVNLKEFSLVYFRQVHKYLQLAGAIATFLKKSNIKFIDSSFENIGASGDKLGNLIKLAMGNISVVPSFYVSRQNLIEEKQRIIEELGFPIFSKNLSKQKREGLFILNNSEDFEKLLEWDKSRGFLLQKKIEIREEFRVVVMGGKIVGVHKEGVRRFDGNKMVVDSEESNEGWIEENMLSKQVTSEAVEGSNLIGLNISGVDACIDEKNEIYIIEINRGPGLTVDPQISPELPSLSNYLQTILEETN